MRGGIPRRRPGFTIVEIITAVAVIAIIAAILVSSDTPESSNDRARYDAAADALMTLTEAVAGYEPTRQRRSFHQVVGVYPSKLSHLTTAITTVDLNICGNAYTGPVGTAGTNLYKWQNAPNPFYGSQLLTAGTIIAPGFTVQNALVLLNAAAAAGANSANTMIIRLPSVTLANAQGLDLAVDGVVDGTTGIIRYSSASDPTVVDYFITISATNSVFVPNC